MSKINSSRSGCKDVFHAFLVKNAQYDGHLEIPIIKHQDDIPNKLILFSKILGCKDYDQWVCFYEDDASFERIWNRPERYLPILSKFKGVITPDFSLYRDMPLVMQQWNIYRGRAIGHWLQENGIHVIPNIRWGDERTYNAACLGISQHSVIAVGSHGCIKLTEERKQFAKGLDYVISKLHPKIIVVYGTAPRSIFEKHEKSGIVIRQFNSEFDLSRKAVNA